MLLLRSVADARGSRLPEVWGEDAAEWNPDRFLNPEIPKQTSVGIYSNL